MIKINWAPNQSSILSSENKRPQEEINVISMGHSILEHNYNFSAYRNVYVLHFLIAGKGTALDNHIDAPKGFLFTPDKHQHFHVTSDTSAPKWEQYWIMLDGTNVKKYLSAAGLPTEAEFFDIPYADELKTFFHFLFRSEEYFDCDDYYYFLSKLNRFFSIHSYAQSMHNKKSLNYNHYVADAIKYIKSNYSHDVQLKDISNYLYISSKYLYKLFKSDTGISPIEYLNEHRIARAQNILSTQSLPIKAVAKEVGFNDPSYFCNVFKKHSNGLSPSEYRKNIK